MHLCIYNSRPPSCVSRLTTAKSLITQRRALSSLPTALFFDSPAHTPHSRMVAPNVYSTPSMTAYALCCSKHRSHPVSGLTPSPHPHLLNRRPCRPRNNSTPFHLLFEVPPEYNHLWVFGCLCYPNLASTAAHKLAPCSARCVFLGYSLDPKGYKCYNPMTKRVIISCHVYFNDTCFPFTQVAVAPPPADSPCSSCPPDDVLIHPGPC